MPPIKSKTLLGDLRELIAEARHDVARQVNSALVLLYWRIGKRIRQDILKEKRALVEANRELIARFEQKMQAKLAEIWGEEESAKA